MITYQVEHHNQVNSVYLSAHYEDRESMVQDHDCFELLFLESGTRKVTVSNRTYVLSPGELIFIRPNEIHYFEKEERQNGKLYIIHFYPQALCSGELSPAFLEDLYAVSKRHFRLTEQVPPYVFRSFVEIARSIHGDSNLKELILRAYTLNLVAWILEEYKKNASVQSGEEKNEKDEKTLEILSYISRHYTENLQLAELAEKYYVSYSHLSRQLKKITGKSFNEHLNELRLAKAAFLLASTKLPIEEISDSLGFCRHSYFAEKFSAKYHITPLKFRQSSAAILAE